MPKLFSRFILSPKDAGMQKYSVEEIAEMMKPRDNAGEQTLMEFACVVRWIFEPLEDDAATAELLRGNGNEQRKDKKSH